MAKLRQWLVVWLMLMVSGSRLSAASAEDRAYTDAVKPFVDGVWDFAETGLAQFVEKFAQSPHRAEAVLRQAQAQYFQATNHLFRQRLPEARQKLEQATVLLTARQGEADKLADEYLYWRGVAHSANTNYVSAADAFGKLAIGFPASTRRLEASVREAAAWAKLGEWLRVTELLQKPDGPFRQAALVNTNSEFFARGLLLLAEAELTQKHHREAEVALQPVASSKLAPELEWQAKYLICRAQLGAGRIEEAKIGSADLLSLAEKTGQRDWLATSVVFRAGILEQLGQLAEATSMYQRNLTTNSPVEQQRQAILKIAGLALAQKRLAETIQTLETFLGRFSNSPATDVAILTLGELHLKQHVALVETNVAATATTGTNHWQLAMTNFDHLIAVSSNRVFVGRAQLGRGWCFWISNNLPESVGAFKAAAAHLPVSEDLAVARFKLADALLAQKEFAAALTNYQGALDVAADLPQAKEALTLPARYQMLRASLGLKEVAGAEDAMRKILGSYPHSFVADRAILLVGQGYADAEKPDQARARFKEFIELFPDSPLRPEVDLAIAQTREQESDWPTAIGAYDAWLSNFPTNSLRPQAEFYRALANYHAGNETNALALFTNVVAQFATNDLAPLAQRWIADYYWDQRDFVAAEINYKRLIDNWPTSKLAYQARMDAGRAAMGRLAYLDAITHFTNLTSIPAGNPDFPPGLKVDALFAYGGALMFAGTNQSANVRNAIQVFATIVDSGTNTEQAALAWGEIGKCYFQLGSYDANNYESASNAYQQVVSSPYAGVDARSQARVGLALVTEKQAELKNGVEKAALLTMARNSFLEVLYETNLRPGETADLFWMKEAGLGAARLAESEPFQEWSQAEKFYDRLLRLLPQMKETLEKKKARVQEHLKRKEN